MQNENENRMENRIDNRIDNRMENGNGNGNRNGDMKRDGNRFRNRFAVRGAVVAAAVASVALVVTGCQSGESSSASASPASASPTDMNSPSVNSPSADPPPAADPSAATPSASSAASTPVTDVTAGAAAPTCSAGSLKVTAHQAADRPTGTGTGAAVVEFTNSSSKACRLKGHPSVAGAGNGSPEHNSPLSVTPRGTASPVTLAPKGKAWVKLTFVQVQGEGDGYCVSGAEPVVYPTIVVGLPGSGRHQVALDDGQFAECDNKVTVTAVSAVKPS
ncbi:MULTISPECIES: DUF4232 domain-containing protein [unclassified Streptomyces]|uniref:DUF4232 domain-containing protein n=1 Tax=unclassified Streptomyces TaxID=2593676 RepID=UPI0037F2E5FA